METDLKMVVEDDSMIDVGIHPEDWVIATSVAVVRDGDIIIAKVNDKMMLRKYFKVEEKICLAPENVNYPTIELNEHDEFKIVGVMDRLIKGDTII